MNYIGESGVRSKQQLLPDKFECFHYLFAEKCRDMERLHIYLFNSFIAFVENSTVTSHVL